MLQIGPTVLSLTVHALDTDILNKLKHQVKKRNLADLPAAIN